MRQYLAFMVIVSLASPVHAQITRRQTVGRLYSESDTKAAASSNQSAKDAFSDIHADVIGTRVTAKVNLNKYPREAQRCIAACDRLEAAIIKVRLELLDKSLTQQSIDNYSDSSRQYLIAYRDLDELIKNPSRPYKLTGPRIKL